MISGLFWLLVSCTGSKVQAQPGAKHSGFLDKKATKTLIDTLAFQLRKYYVFGEAANRMGAYIQKRFKEGAYSAISDPHILAGQLTKDVSSVHLDEHFHVEYNPESFKELSGEIEDVPKFVEEKLNQERYRNFGFKTIEILNGNIGYLEISSFSRLNQFSKAAAQAALQSLSNSSALIIDLRYGVGGSLDMVTYLMSRFFREKILIMDIYLRSEKDTLHYYTSPDTIPGKLSEIPIYVLTSYKTFSAAEALAYGLQSQGRATIVGEVTRGGAHTVKYRSLSSGFIADIPFGVARNPITKTNWEKIGITPDIMVSEDKALETAEYQIFEKARKKASDSLELRKLDWEFDLIQSINHPLQADSTALKKLSGHYGPYSVYFRNGQLFYQKVGKAVYPLLPLKDNLMKVKGNDSFRIAFNCKADGNCSSIITLYEDGRREVANRSQ